MNRKISEYAIAISLALIVSVVVWWDINDSRIASIPAEAKTVNIEDESVPAMAYAIPGMEVEKIEKTASEDYLTELENLIDYWNGNEVTISWSQGTALSKDVLTKLRNTPEMTLIFSFNYEGEDHRVIIKGRDVVIENDVYWYGPLYLIEAYGDNK